MHAFSVFLSSSTRSADRARLRRCLHACAGLALLLWCTGIPLRAEAARYAVQIVASPELEKLLQDNLDIVRWSKREEVTAGQVEQLYKTASEQIAELLATEGYFSAHVEGSFERQTAPEVIRFVIEPGEPARIASMDLRIVGPVTANAQASRSIADARAAFTLHVGDRFRQKLWAQGKDAVVHSLSRRVYAAARVSSSRVQINPETHAADVQLEVDSGPPFTFGALKVNGLSRYARSVVINLNPIRPGDPYDEDELIKFQRRLLATGYFASAIVAARAQSGSAQSLPVIVNLVESPAQRVELGMGLSTDRGLRAQLDYSDHNLLDRAWRLSSGIHVDRLSQSLTAGLQFPRNERGYHYGLEGKFKNEDIQGQRVTDWSTTGAHTYVAEEYVSSQALQFLVERSSLVGGNVDNRQALFLSQTWTWNGLDDLINPRRGYLASLEVGGASDVLAPQWGAAVFYDTGNAFDDWHELNPVNGYGAGIRWRSPLGALSLDLAYGEEARSFRVHFSAGFAFR